MSYPKFTEEQDKFLGEMFDKLGNDCDAAKVDEKVFQQILVEETMLLESRLRRRLLGEGKINQGYA